MSKRPSYEQYQSRDSSKELSELAKSVITTYSKENPKAFESLIEKYNGESADVAIFGVGKIHIKVNNGEVSVDSDRSFGKGSTGMGAVHPKTIVSIVEGKMTVIEAFHKGDLIAQSKSDNLHRVYNDFVQYSETLIESDQNPKYYDRFREICEL